MGSHPQLANMEDYFRERLLTPWSLRACRTGIEKVSGLHLPTILDRWQ